MGDDNQKQQNEFIQNIVNTALEQANKYQTPNNGLNIRNINIRFVDVIMIISFVTVTVFAFATNYYTIESYISNSKPKIEKLERKVETLQEFKLETKLLLKSHVLKIKKLEADSKKSRRISIDASNQVQDIYSNVNMLLNKIDILERDLNKIDNN